MIRERTAKMAGNGKRKTKLASADSLDGAAEDEDESSNINMIIVPTKTEDGGSKSLIRCGHISTTTIKIKAKKPLLLLQLQDPTHSKCTQIMTREC